jgi:hypothetical protein
MARPRGHPKSGGRKKGTPNKATLVRQQELAASGELPLDSMLSVMRDETADVRRRDAMAVAAAPYVHPRLATIPHTAESEKPTPMVVSVEFVRAIDGRPAPPDLPANVARLPLAKTG